MKALYYPEYGELVVNDQPVPGIEADEVLLKVAACGICGSELETFAHRSERRKPPSIMGHEFSGTVARVGSQVTGLREGDRVVSNSIVACGECAWCRRGETNLCPRRQVFGMHRGGAFAEYVNVPARCVIPMDARTDFRAACLTEPLANGVHIVGLTRHLDASRVLVLGAGPIGLMAQQAFQALTGAEVLVADVCSERLEVARRLGAARVLNPRETDLEGAVAELTASEGLPLVVDAVGMEATNRQGLALLRPGGTLVMIGLHQNGTPFQSYDIILGEKKITGSYAATQQDMTVALDLIAAGRVDVTSWVNYYPLSDGEAAFRGMLSPGNTQIKSVIIL
jgi:L-iditol 2-dehydrogenase